MAQKQIAGVTVEVNDEGYFVDPKVWTKEMAGEMAGEYKIELTEKHYAVLQFLREKQASGEALTIRRMGNSGVCDIKEFYQLFPGGPLKVSSKLAGIPKPVSCI
jgi:tRNA 2-thiouridine synthesizing protein E